LYFQLAALRDLRGDLPGAEELCRKALEQEPRNVVVLNNLAWLLSQNGKGTEGLTVINRAIELAGPRAELLDTRATVYLSLNRGDLAIADLEAANLDGSTPTRYFHLAQAQRLVNNSKEALAQLQKATKSGLKKEHLHPVERAAYDKLVDELKPR
jgi:Flp pilus assembly protein TadD